jgi:uncharacterized protein (TIGR02996 family)
MNPLRLALETVLRENPEDLTAAMAWADHAAEQGDPRGEFAQIQIALEDPNRSPHERADLQKHERELLLQYQAEWLGPLFHLFEGTNDFGLEYNREDELKFHFARGWLHTVHFDHINLELIRALAECPTATILRELGVNCNDYENPGIPHLEHLPFLSTLKKFRLGYEKDQCRVHESEFPAVLSKMPHVEELQLYASGRLAPWMNQVFALPLPRLRRLVVHHHHDYPLEILAENPSMRNLITLDCFPHALEPDDEEAYIRTEGFVALVQSSHLPSLTHLTLRLHEIGDDAISFLIASGRLKQLKTLDFYGGNFTDVAANMLANSPDICNLTRLNLTHNYLTSEGVARLQAVVPHLEAEGQFDASRGFDPDEREHLWYGDCE